MVASTVFTTVFARLWSSYFILGTPSHARLAPYACFFLSLDLVRCRAQVLSDHLVKTLNNESAQGFRPPKPGKEAEWASCLPFPLVAVICESDAGLANAGGQPAGSMVSQERYSRYSGWVSY